MKYLLVSILCLFAALCLSSCSKPPQHPNVIVMVLDTLRADHLGAYGYSRNTSPKLDAFARENRTFLYAVTAAPWTPASVATILTGLYPTSHGMMPPNDREAARGASKLNPSLNTLAERFVEAGYSSAALTPNPWMSKEFGYEQGFGEYHYLLRARADVITNNAIEVVDRLRGSSKPFFLYVHYLDPHDPYDPPGEFAGMYKGATERKFSYPAKMADFIAAYDGEISYMDREIGRFFDHLKANKLWEDAVIVIVGDHGEQFMEHGDHRHGFKLFNEELHVPLMLKAPRAVRARGRVDHTVSTVDIAPTVLQLAHLPISPGMPGVSLLDDAAIEKRRAVLSEIRRKYSQKGVTARDGKKLILEVPLAEDSADLAISLQRWENPNVVGIFDRNQDYEEREPVQDTTAYSDLRGQFEELLKEAVRLRVQGADARAEVSDETLEQLKSLGYLQ